MVEKVRKRGKKVSKQRKLNKDSQNVPTSSSATASTSALDGSNANYIPLGNDVDSAADQDGTPNWVRLEERASKAATEAPFGYVDVEVKAYFRAGYERINELESQGYSSPNIVSALRSGGASNKLKQDVTGDAEDELGLLLQATLQEMDGKELSLCTDPDTSVIVEGVLHRLPAKPLRVYVDRLSGNFTKLAKHRFGSHVVQAALSALQLGTTLEHASEDDLLGTGATARKTRKRTSNSDSAAIVNEDGILRSATQLLLDITDEIAPELLTLVADPFGSHVIRTLLAVLTGRNVFAASAAERSKRSAKFRSKKWPSSTANGSALADSTEDLIVAIPDTFLVRARELHLTVQEQTDPTEIKRWAIDPVASPLLQLMIEIEAEFRLPPTSSDVPYWKDSLTNTVLDGLVVDSLEQDDSAADSTDKISKRKDHLESSLRDSVASHVLQLALAHAPSATIALFFSVYVAGRMGKLCVHPAANHIVLALIGSLAISDLETATSELGMIGTSMVKEKMVGCLQALVDRVSSLDQTSATKEFVQKVSGVVVGAFGLTSANDASEAEKSENGKLLVPAMLALKTKQAYLTREQKVHGNKRGHKRARDGSTKKSKTAVTEKDDGSNDDEAGDIEAPQLKQAEWTMDESHELTSAETTMQGSLLLQSFLRLPGSSTPSAVRAPIRNGLPRPSVTPEPAYGCTLVYDSLLNLTTLVPLAKNAVAVHVLIAALNPALPPAASAPKRKLFTALLARLAAFCGDKYGSRLADYMWATADGYQREKIVAAVIEHNTEILKTQYASFFTNKLNLHLYRKGRVREWTVWAKTQQQSNADAADTAQKKDNASVGPGKNRVVVQVSKPDAKKNSKKKARIDTELDAILQDL